MAYGLREVLIRGYVERVVISCAAEVIARHKRSDEREDLVFDPLHDLPVIERKVGALDQAASLRGWDLPVSSPPCGVSWRPVWAPGITVPPASASTSRALRLLESFPLGEVEAAVREALIIA